MNRGRGSNRGGGRRHGSGGRSPRPVGVYVVRQRPVVGSPIDGASLTHESGSSGIGRNFGITSVDGVTKKINDMSTSDYSCEPNSKPSKSFGNSELVQRVPEAEEEMAKPLDLPSVVRQPCNNDFPSLSTQFELNSRTTGIIPLRDEEEDNRTLSCSSLTASDATYKKNEPSQAMGSHFQDGQIPWEVQNGKNATDRTIEFENSEQHKGLCFDICEERNKNVVKLKTSLLDKNRAMRNEAKRRTQGNKIEILRSGMILLKGYLPLADQVKLIKMCRDLGRGPGGFYQPGYRDGATLHLKMMCLGKNWDPETSKYDDIRPIDGTKPPPIPDDFMQIVKRAIKECHDHLGSQSKGRNPREIIPSMSPNICIVNFYSKTGKLGLHQDKDESEESLRKRLPVVSISLGDKAKFLFGEQRDTEKAEKVELESGDVLIFGGESRHIFHGVSAIHPDTAPKALLDETNLRPGRLNLTFREY